MMQEMQSCNITLFDKTFKLFGYEGDGAFEDIKFHGTWGEFDLNQLKSLISPTSRCLDLGANIGIMSLAMSVLCPQGRVYAVEGSLRISECLRRTFDENYLNCTAYCHVIGIGPMQWADVASQSCSGSVVGTARRPEETIVSSRLGYTIDEFMLFYHISHVDLIKMDLEGMEPWALRGAAKTLQKCQPKCLIEFNTYALVHLQEIAPRHFLSQLFNTFNKISFYRGRTGELIEIKNTAEDREAFLNWNFFHGLVDDLLCEF